MDYDTLRQDLSELRLQREQLVRSLTDSIDRLRTSGTSMGQDVLDRAGRYRHTSLDLLQRLKQLPGSDQAGPRVPLDAWDQLIYLAQRQQRMQDRLGEIETLRVRGVDGAGPLSNVMEDVQTLRQRLHDRADPVWDDLVEGRHPLSSLQRLMHQGEELSDSEWSELLDRVSAAYGRELATAISRGKVYSGERVPLHETRI